MENGSQPRNAISFVLFLIQLGLVWLGFGRLRKAMAATAIGFAGRTVNNLWRHVENCHRINLDSDMAAVRAGRRCGGYVEVLLGALCLRGGATATTD